MPTTTMQTAAHTAIALQGRSAEELGWPDRSHVAGHLATAVWDGLGADQYSHNGDPQGWCLNVLAPAIERHLDVIDDLRDIGWPNTPSTAAMVVQWMIDDGIIR